MAKSTYDPLRGLRGVIAGTLVLEAIALLLVLTVIARIASGAYWTTTHWVYIVCIAVLHLLLVGCVRARWCLYAVAVLQLLALGGGFIHVSMAVVAVVFIAVWAYVVYLRKVIIDRRDLGLLTSQYNAETGEMIPGALPTNTDDHPHAP